MLYLVSPKGSLLIFVQRPSDLIRPFSHLSEHWRTRGLVSCSPYSMIAMRIVFQDQ